MLNSTTREWLADPFAIVERSWEELHSQDSAAVDAYRVAAMQERFADLQPKIRMLQKLAEGQGISRISAYDDMAPLLFTHTVYKSYPISLIEKRRFDQLTGWLGQLTTHDLAPILREAKECTTIDEWLDLLDRRTELRVIHTSGTSGKLSFMPRSTRELKTFTRAMFKPHEWGRSDSAFIRGLLGGTEKVDIFYPSFRKGRYVVNRILDAMVDAYSSEERIHTLYPGGMSADIVSLSGRIAAAERRGENGSSQISPDLLDRHRAFIESMKDREQQMARFFDGVIANHSGRRVLIFGTMGLLVDAAVKAQALGYSKVFHPDSLVSTGGGVKGGVLPKDWESVLQEFLGVPSFRIAYSMSEALWALPNCSSWNYHIPPFVVPYLLDVETGRVLPREGTATGRFAFFDLLAQTYWGGFVTGDEVTIHWDEACPCGCPSPWIERQIRRVSERAGGDDKISCAGANDAHDRALEVLEEALH